MIQISKIVITQAEKEAVNNVLDSNIIVQGPKVAELEDKFAKAVSCKFAIAVSNGTAALHTALSIAGIGPGDEVITSPFTFIATANSIVMAGATPIFADIDEHTYNLNPQSVEKKISSKTKAILVVDLYGHSVDYGKFREIADKHKLLLISDACQSFGAKYKESPIGSLADISCFSLYATKNLMSGEGGMITTNNAEYSSKAKMFRHHGQSESVRYHYFGLGYNYRMTDINAAIALEQLKKNKSFTQKRRENAKYLSKKLSSIVGIETPIEESYCFHVYHQYTLRILPSYGLTRDELQTKLLENDIQSNIYYPVPLYNVRHLSAGGEKKDFPITEKIVQEVLSIPVHPFLQKKELNKIIDIISNYEKK